MYSSGDSLDSIKINKINDHCDKTREPLSPLNGFRNINVPKNAGNNEIVNSDNFECNIQGDVEIEPCLVTMANISTSHLSQEADGVGIDITFSTDFLIHTDVQLQNHVKIMWRQKFILILQKNEKRFSLPFFCI